MSNPARETVKIPAAPAAPAAPAGPRAAPAPTRRIAGLIALVFALTSVVGLSNPTPVQAWSAGSFSSASEKELIALTNRSRASAGLKALKVDGTLTSVARWRSKDMITRDYFSHTIPGYGSVFKKLDSKGYCYKLAGENIGWNTNPDGEATAVIHSMFMDSSGHRKNILGKAWDVIGVGAYKGPDGKKMWTVLFADKCGGTSTKPKATPKPTPKPTAKPKPKATPKPTPRPTPRPTPAPTPTPALTSAPRDPVDATGDGRGKGYGPGGVGNSPGNGGDNGNGGSSGNGPPPGNGPTGGTDQGLRVLADTSSAGLVETIVGGVTGLFFGA